MDTLFAQPTQPSSAPRVRAFAELALNEIRSGVGGDASLLEDKQAFSEFMDRINESVLLGRREPPSAASVLRDYSQQGEEDSVDPPAPDNDASVASPSSSSLQSFDINSSGNAGPLTVATHLEALSSKIKLSFSPRRHHRQHTDNADPGHAVQSQKPPITSHGVRFDVCSEDEGLRAGVRLSAPLQYRKQGVKFAQEEEGLDLGNEAPLSSCDLATRPKLLQELRRWRSEATAEINTDHNLPTFPPPPKASISGRPSLQSTWGSSLPLSSQPLGMPPPSAPAVHRGDNRAASTRGKFTGSERVNQSNMSEEPQELRTTGGRECEGGEHNRVTGGGELGETTRRTEESNGELHPRGTARLVAQGNAVQTLPMSNRRSRGNSLVDGADVTSAGQHWRDFGPNGGGKGMLSKGRKEGFGEAAEPVEEEGQQEQDGATELSLDLSDCSDERLGALLQRGRRRGSNRAG